MLRDAHTGRKRRRDSLTAHSDRPGQASFWSERKRAHYEACKRLGVNPETTRMVLVPIEEPVEIGKVGSFDEVTIKTYKSTPERAVALIEAKEARR